MTRGEDGCESVGEQDDSLPTVVREDEVEWLYEEVV
jgi:hypothetical protein